VSAVPVPVNALESGDFPPLCVKTAVPTNLKIQTTLSRTPGWTWVLLLFGILPFFLVQVLASEKVPVRLPVSEEAWARARAANRFSLGVLGAIVVAVALLLVPAFRIELLGWLIAILIVVEIVAVVMWNWQWVGLARGQHRGELVLTRVHRDFARAYGHYVAEHRPDRS
jgi:hypothetical protein